MVLIKTIVEIKKIEVRKNRYFYNERYFFKKKNNLVIVK